MHADRRLYAVMAEFESADAIVDATRRVHAEGYRLIDAYSPFPVEPLWEAMEANDRRLPMMVLAGGIVGGSAGFGLCYWVSAIAYPLNIGGRPLNSWPAFIPVTFEMTILIAALTAVFGMFALNGFPAPYHPAFNVPRFRAAGSGDAFFLEIQVADPKFDQVKTRELLRSLGAKEIHDVEP